MRRLPFVAEIAAPADAVWELLVDTRRWPEWGPSIRRVQCDPPRIDVGVTGRVQTIAGVWLSFEITRLEEGRSWDWRVGRAPATGHEIESLGADGCRVTFTVPWIATPYGIVVLLALRRLERLAVARDR